MILWWGDNFDVDPAIIHNVVAAEIQHDITEFDVW